MAGFQQVAVNRDLVFRGAALYQPNVKGPMLTELKIVDETFVNDSLGDWDEEEDNGSVISHSAVDGGAMIITCNGSADKDCGELSHTAQWSAARNCGMEAKVKISQITVVGIAIGFVDAKENDDDHISGELESDAALRDPTNTHDAALFIFDTDNAVTTAWYVAAIDSDAIGTPVVANGSVAPVENTYFRVRVQTDTDGNVTFYYNGVAVGYLATAIGETSTELLTPYVGFISRSAANPVCTISRVTTWQDCS